jgi:hypothetical protein
MNPKEKAIELLNKAMSLELSEVQYIKNDIRVGVQSRLVGIMMVDEILNLEPLELSYMEEFSKSYWQEVKSELEKL